MKFLFNSTMKSLELSIRERNIKQPEFKASQTVIRQFISRTLCTEIFSIIRYKILASDRQIISPSRFPWYFLQFVQK